MAKPIYVVNGPNLNLLGAREPEVYGRETLDDLRARCERKAATLGFSLEFRQSNHEGELVAWIQEARTEAAGLIVNAGAFTHTSIAMLDALLACPIPSVEVRAATRRSGVRARLFNISSVIPAANHCWSRVGDRSSKGRTAID